MPTPSLADHSGTEQAAAADDGLPLAVQFTGRRPGEATLLRLAAEIERAEDWNSTRPPAWSSVSA